MNAQTFAPPWMPLVLVIRLPLRTVSKLNVREHWAASAKRRKAERHAAFVSCGQEANYHRLELPVDVLLTRIGPRALDGDNLQGSLKSVRDGVASALGLKDDSSPLVSWAYEQRKGRQRTKTQAAEYAVEVRITERPRP